MNRLSASIGFLFILVLLINIPAWFSEEPEVVDVSNNNSGQPNYQSDGMLSTIFNENGEINHQVFAKHMEHYEQQDVTVFEQPEYTVYTADDGAPWRMRAKKGTLFGENRIYLETDVVINSLNQSDFVQSIRAEYVEIDLDTRQMKSDQPVVINGVNFVTNSNGFLADLATKKFELINQVRTVYDPDPQP